MGKGRAPPLARLENEVLDGLAMLASRGFMFFIVIRQCPYRFLLIPPKSGNFRNSRNTYFISGNFTFLPIRLFFHSHFFTAILTFIRFTVGILLPETILDK
jgi:hypothetical protein